MCLLACRRGTLSLLHWMVSTTASESMFSLFRKRMSYEDYGYMCASSLLPELIEQPSRSAGEWAGIDLDTDEVAKQLAILCLAFHQFCHIGLVSQDAGQRLLEGMMRRFDERFQGFSSGQLTVETMTTYLRAAASDIKNKSKSESFPTLVPTAIARITGLQPTDSHWHSSSEILYSILEVILKIAEPTLVGIQKHARLV